MGTQPAAPTTIHLSEQEEAVLRDKAEVDLIQQSTPRNIRYGGLVLGYVVSYRVVWSEMVRCHKKKNKINDESR